jgi:hypothetical protein
MRRLHCNTMSSVALSVQFGHLHLSAVKTERWKAAKPHLDNDIFKEKRGHLSRKTRNQTPARGTLVTLGKYAVPLPHVIARKMRRPRIPLSGRALRRQTLTICSGENDGGGSVKAKPGSNFAFQQGRFRLADC